MEGAYKFTHQQFEYQPKKKPPVEKKAAVFSESKAKKKQRENKIEEITADIQKELSQN